jgi:hypothetical protein
VALAIDIAGAVPPEETTGAVPVTPVTVPVLLVLLLNVVQSAAVKAPLLAAEALGTCKVITADPDPPATVELKSVPVVPKVNAATLVTVPELLLKGKLLIGVLSTVPTALPVVFNINIESASGTVIADIKAEFIKFAALFV